MTRLQFRQAIVQNRQKRQLNKACVHWTISIAYSKSKSFKCILQTLNFSLLWGGGLLFGIDFLCHV